MNEAKKQIERLLFDVDSTNEVVLLPTAFDEDGKGIYDDSQIVLWKALRADGIPCIWAQPADQRTYQASRSVGEVILGFVLSVPASVVAGLVVAKLQQLFGNSPRGQLSIVQETSPDGTERKWLTVSDLSDQAAADLVARLNPPQLPMTRGITSEAEGGSDES